MCIYNHKHLCVIKYTKYFLWFTAWKHCSLPHCGVNAVGSSGKPIYPSIIIYNSNKNATPDPQNVIPHRLEIIHHLYPPTNTENYPTICTWNDFKRIHPHVSSPSQIPVHLPEAMYVMKLPSTMIVRYLYIYIMLLYPDIHPIIILINISKFRTWNLVLYHYYIYIWQCVKTLYPWWTSK